MSEIKEFSWFKLSKESKRESYRLRECIINVRNGKAHYSNEFGLTNPVKFSNFGLNKGENK